MARVAGASELERLVHRSRLLGADASLVVHGGGNTSTKLVEEDHLGRERRVLRIKGTGADLATITAADFPGVYLDDLLTLRGRERMEDDELVAFVERCLVEPAGRRPSIETVLHAFLPGTHVDHVHSDAICALTNTPRCDELIAEALGPDIRVVPYMRPGFALARAVDAAPAGRAIVLRHHGLVTFGETHEESINLTFELERRARDYLAAHGATSARVPDLQELDEDVVLGLLPQLRGAVSKRGLRVLHLDPEQRRYSDRADVETIAAAARSTPDHMLRVGRSSAVVHPGSWQADMARFEQERLAEFERHSLTGAVVGPPETAPRVMLIPGLGCVAVGASGRAAGMHADIAGHSHGSVASTVDAFGAVEWLDDREASEFLYWPLELYKLTLAPAAKELAGHVVVVTGAASGIGRVVALELASRGAQLALADIDEGGLDDTLGRIDADAVVGVAADLTAEEDVARLVRTAVKRFGGIDGVVSNAGIAVAGRLATLSTAEWDKSLAINATAHFLLTRCVWPVLEAQGLGGSIVYVASKNAFSPGAGFGAYSAAKAAEIQIARIAALEGGASRIRANVVNPDAIFAGSALWSGQMRRDRASEHGVEPDQLEDFYASRNLLGRKVTAADVAEAVAFLLSPRSAATTGCVLPVDGGVAGAFPR